MAFQAIFYTFTKKSNSTARPGIEGRYYNLVIKAGSGIIHPHIELDLGLNDNPSGYNYCYIPVFKKFYFIREWTFSERLWDADLDEDFLATWKTEIGSSSLYVLRSAAQYDGTIIDEFYPAVSTPNINSSTVTTFYDSLDMQSGGTFICGIIGVNSSAIGAVNYYAFTRVQFLNLMNALMSSNAWLDIGTDELSDGAQKMLYNPVQYITSCIWLPYSLSSFTSTTVASINYGWWTFAVPGNLITSFSPIKRFYNPSWSAHPQSTARGMFTDHAPYTRRYFDLPPFGHIELDTAVFTASHPAHFQVDCDIITGAGFLRVEDSEGQIFQNVQAQIGVTIQVAQLSYNLDSQISAATSIAGVVGNVLSGNIGGAITSGISAIGDGIKSQIPVLQSTGMNGGTAGLYGGRATITSVFYPIVDDNIAEHGRPLCKIVKLSTLPGYQLIEHGDVEMPGTREETDSVRELLESGYYYE